MNIIKIEDVAERMYQSFKKTLADFAKTEDNKEVYAVVFDCNIPYFDVCLRYANARDYQKRSADYDKYADLYKPYGKKGLFGFKYNAVGDFKRIDFAEDSAVKYFRSSGCCQSAEAVYYDDADRPADTFSYRGEMLRGDVETELMHYDDGAFQKDGAFFLGLAPKLMELFEEMVVSCILRLKEDELGLDQTDDFIMFMCGHDESNADFAAHVSRTVEKDLFEQLTDDSE